MFPRWCALIRNSNVRICDRRHPTECVHFVIIVSVCPYYGRPQTVATFFFPSHFPFSIFPQYHTLTLVGETSPARARDAWPRLIPHCLHAHAYATTTVRAADVAALKSRQFATAATAKCLRRRRRRDEQCEARNAHSSRCTDYYYLYHIYIYTLRFTIFF